MTLHLLAPEPIRLVPLAHLSASGAWQMELLHDRSEALMIWLTRGQGTAVMDGIRRGLGVHNLLYFPPRTAMAFEMGRQAFGHALIIPADSPMALPDSPLHLRVRDAASQVELSGLIDALGREQVAARPYCDSAMLAYGTLIAVWLQRQMALADIPKDSASRRLMRRYCARLVDHYASPATMADHAAALGVTPTHLTRVCRAQTGKTAAALLTERILYAARRGLTETNQPVQDVARDLGFGSAPYFTRFIHQHTGRNPTALRQSARRHA